MSNRGYTIAELLVVIAIAVIVMALGASIYSKMFWDVKHPPASAQLSKMLSLAKTMSMVTPPDPTLALPENNIPGQPRRIPQAPPPVVTWLEILQDNTLQICSQTGTDPIKVVVAPVSLNGGSILTIEPTPTTIPDIKLYFSADGTCPGSVKIWVTDDLAQWNRTHTNFRVFRLYQAGYAREVTP